MKRNDKKYFFLLSIAWHGLLLACISLIISITPATLITFGEKQSVLSVYLPSETQALPEKRHSTLVTQSPTQKKISYKMKNKMPLKKNSPQTKIEKNISPEAKKLNSSESSQAQSNEKPIPELIALLHAAIQSHQAYPAHALEMGLEGKTTLIFTLFPNGNIENLKILHSSGSDALDQAALEAVQNATPFQNINHYLTKPDNYQITVSFELT